MKSKPTLHIEVTERALIQRINRALPDGQKVRIARGKRAGLFYLVRDGANIDVNLGALGRELRVLRFHERLPEVQPRITCRQY